MGLLLQEDEVVRLNILYTILEYIFALSYSHKYCIPDCAVTVMTPVNSIKKLETCMFTKNRQFLEEWHIMAIYTQLFESTSCMLI